MSRNGDARSWRSLIERAGSPFEIDDHEIVARIEHLSQVVIAVAADAGGVDFPLHDPPQPLEDLSFPRNNGRRLARLLRTPAPRLPRSVVKVRAARLRTAW